MNLGLGSAALGFNAARATCLLRGLGQPPLPLSICKMGRLLEQPTIAGGHGRLGGELD